MLAPGWKDGRLLREGSVSSLTPHSWGSGVSLSCEGQVDQREGRRMVSKGKQNAQPKLRTEERDMG